MKKAWICRVGGCGVFLQPCCRYSVRPVSSETTRESDHAGSLPGEPLLPEAKMHLVMPGSPVKGRVTSTRLCMKGKSASFVRHVCIDVSGTPLERNFLAGQSFGIVPPGVDHNGKPHKVRLYSIASPTCGEDGQGKVLSTTPKRLLDERRPERPTDDPTDHSLFVGVASNYICDLKVGDEVMVTGPNGKRFLLPMDPSAHDYIFLATGTGIAPFRGMTMELLDRPAPCDSAIHLVMGTPYTTDLLYDELFTGYAAKYRNFHYHAAISREKRRDGRPGVYVHQFIEENLDLFSPLLSSPRTLIYVCGLAGMQVGLFQVLAKHGFGGGFLNVHEELSGVPPVEWTTEQIKRRVRPTHRCMLEVY
jgi:ferredoxin--NADP+ reductase